MLYFSFHFTIKHYFCWFINKTPTKYIKSVNAMWKNVKTIKRLDSTVHVDGLQPY